ncbi:MAG: hypothetical protein JWQ25_595 [Daejeonella sp.]|nr:hypothetical protein [Daejeonella sp.]
MKKILLLLVLVIINKLSYAQTSGSITVGGDINNFYPVTWFDGARNENIATHLELGRTNIHLNSSVRGSLIAKFDFHVSDWGHRSNFIDADITYAVIPFAAGWADASTSNSSVRMIIWLRGGGTTYYYKGTAAVDPVVYDGVQNPLPYQESNGPAHTFKTSIDAGVNSTGITKQGNAYFNGGGVNYFGGNVGIGTTTPSAKLSVNGNILAKEIKVKSSNLPDWPDFVFGKSFQNTSLPDLEKYIQENSHLPNIPSASEVEKDGINLGEMNAKLLQKIEELTLHLIEMNKKLDAQQAEITCLKQNK